MAYKLRRNKDGDVITCDSCSVEEPIESFEGCYKCVFCAGTIGSGATVIRKDMLSQMMHVLLRQVNEAITENRTAPRSNDVSNI